MNSTHAFHHRRPGVWIGLIAACFTLLVSALSASPIDIRISSQFLVRGEQVQLEYIVDGSVSPSATLAVAQIDDVSIRPIGRGGERSRGFGRRPQYTFRYAVTSYTPGTFRIPPARLTDGTNELRSEPVTLRVFNETDLEWKNISVGGRTMRYAAAFHVSDHSPFVNEVLPTELKVYIPANQRIEDWGIPEFERNGVAAWRFEPRPSLRRVNLLGRDHIAVSYPSTLSPTRSGTVELGPAKLRLVTVQTSVQNFGQGYYENVFLQIPKLTLTARELPAGAPEGFEDAVGEFELNVTMNDTEIREGDPVSVNMMISGRGNLDTLNPPKPIDPEGWKLYPPSTNPRSTRREISGHTIFRQFMRPLVPQSQVPPFRFVYFDPNEETYRTLMSTAIPLTMIPSAGTPTISSAVPPALSMPVENMSDILGIIPSKNSLLPENSRELASRWWWIAPVLLAVILLIRVFQLRVQPRLHRDPVITARKASMQELEGAPTDAKGFYLAAGRVVERWLGDQHDGLPGRILAKRDETCFTGATAAQPLPRSERKDVIRGLRRLVLPLLVLAACFSAERSFADEPEVTAETAELAYEEGRYTDAARLWLDEGPYEQLSADTLYNIGNAAYRLDASGEAALYWRRALARDSSHAEARQNLRFFERKFGSIVIKRPEHQYYLSKLSLSTWRNMLIGAGCLAGLALLVFPATRAGARLRIVAITSLVAAPIIAAAAFCGWYYYPDDARFAPLAEQAVITADRVDVVTDAARNSPLVITAPAGSLCRIVHESGDWTYIAFTNETRGWVPTDQIGRIEPLETPSAPAPTLPDEADGQSA